VSCVYFVLCIVLVNVADMNAKLAGQKKAVVPESDQAAGAYASEVARVCLQIVMNLAHRCREAQVGGRGRLTGSSSGSGGSGCSISGSGSSGSGGSSLILCSDYCGYMK
jgi:uncharacterized membrane protein YgcG